MATRWVASGLATALLLAGCVAQGSDTDGPPTPVVTPGSTGTAAPTPATGRTPGTPTPTAPSPTADAPEPDAAQVRTAGTPVAVGGLTWWVAGTAVTPAAQDDGSVLVTIEVDVTPGSAGSVAVRVAGPEGAALTAEADGTVLASDPAGLPLGGLDVPSSSDGRRVHTEVTGDGVLGVVTAPPDAGASPAPTTVTLWFGTATIAGVDWGEREGGRSLAVVPTPWLRTGGLAAQAVGWAALVALEPEVDVPGMQDQFLCHALGAPDKASWNLEPWRPAVGYLDTLLAGCNPT